MRGKTRVFIHTDKVVCINNNGRSEFSVTNTNEKTIRRTMQELFGWVEFVIVEKLAEVKNDEREC